MSQDRVYVAVALWRGLVDDVGVFKTARSANNYIKETTGKTPKGIEKEAGSNPMADWAGSCIYRVEVKT